ncbi:MAG: DUF5615 family PIN-like protein [Saprospiraceae bacterium]|nr:DUF5615 family PIN-like protein [Saprospiraceae bacterium]
MVKLLIDANLSYRLVKKLAGEFSDCLHVSKTGLSIPANDNDIWDWAKQNNYIIVTNDEDYYNLTVYFGFPPKVVLLRMGNQSTNFIAEVLKRHKSHIEQMTNSSDYGILEIF